MSDPDSQTCYGKAAMPIERKAHNLRALKNALQSDLPTMKAEAERLISQAIASHDTLKAAAESLGITYLAFARLRAGQAAKKTAKRKR